MSKKLYCASVIILSGFIISMIIMTKPTSSSFITQAKVINSIKPKVLPIATLVIPKINLQQPLYSLKSKENNVSKNVTILEGSIFPNQEKSIMFLAAHSGEGKIAYFDNLDQLNIGDIIIFKYKKYNYYYNIDNIFEEEKDGDIEINKSSNQQLVLTTCSKKSSKKQLIINSNLLKKEEI